jgi:hypothetical protein
MSLASQLESEKPSGPDGHKPPNKGRAGGSRSRSA